MPRNLPINQNTDDTLARASALRSRPGFAFLDSSLPDSGSISLLAAEPTDILKGHLSSPSQLRETLSRHATSSTDTGRPTGGLLGHIDFDGNFTFGVYPHFETHPTPVEQSESLPDIPSIPSPTSQVDREMFCAMVSQAKSYIAAGDIYQVNLSRRFTTPWPEEIDPYALYRILRHHSPAPYSAFLDLDGTQILSSSPECFLRMSGPTVETRPIKGTRPRFSDPHLDQQSAAELVTSPKEIAELVMITDLERNDLGQVCEFGSVTVPEMLQLERFAQVFHLVSTVRGLIRPELDHLDVLSACFPGGSISGAPKRRALEIIDELEPEPRGLYTGAIGYLGFNGESQFNIAIRTAIVENQTLSFHVGAGIVADSDPALEFEETNHKAAGLLSAIHTSQEPTSL